MRPATVASSRRSSRHSILFRFLAGVARWPLAALAEALVPARCPVGNEKAPARRDRGEVHLGEGVFKRNAQRASIVAWGGTIDYSSPFKRRKHQSAKSP